MPCAGLKAAALIAVLAAGCVSKPITPSTETTFEATNEATNEAKSGDDKRAAMADIRGVIGAHLSKISSCYEQAIEARPGAAGKMSVRWQLGPDGVPFDIAIVENDLSLRAAEECVLHEVRLMRFRERAGGEILDILYPFYFSENGRFLKSKTGGDPR